MLRQIGALCALSLICVAFGCTSHAPPASGFLSDYSRLTEHPDGAMRYVSPKLKDYSSFMLDPVQMRAQGGLKPDEAAEVVRYFNEAFANVLTERGYKIVSHPGVGVARARFALTNIQESTWWMNVHPASKLTGVGTGGASMEGEVIDSVTGEQLGAVIQSGKGSQFELDTFSKLDDVKDTIDRWAKHAGERLDQLRRSQ